MEINERDRVRTRNKLLNLAARVDPHLGKYDELIVRELFKTESEQNVMSDEKKQLCERLVEYAWESVHKTKPSLSCVKIANSLARIYQNVSAVGYYGQLLCQLIGHLCVEQAKQIDACIEQRLDSQILASSWLKHNKDLMFLIEFFVPGNVQGELMQEILKEAAIVAYRQIVITGSQLQVDVLKRYENAKMTRDEHITAIRILNAVEERFFAAHLTSTLVKLRQLFEQSLLNTVNAAELVFETVEWLEVEMKMFAIISSDAPQNQTFKQTIREHIVKKLLVDHLKLEGNFCQLINSKEFEALKQLYLLFESVEDGSSDLIELLANFIKQKKVARTLSSKSSFNVASPKSPPRVPHSVAVVNDFLAFKSLLFNLVLNDCFHADIRYCNRIELELQRLMLAQEHFPQYLAFYIDYQLKRRQHEDVNRAADLLHYIGDEEPFEQFYRGHLSSRLINGTPSDLSAERSLVERFKAEKGRFFTHKMEKMIEDVSHSRSLLSEFVQTLDPEASVNVAEVPPPIIQGVQFTATVLTENFWPAHYRPTACRLPPHVSNLFAAFKSFYLAKHSGRKLALNAGVGSAVLSVRFYGLDALQATQNRVAQKDTSPIDLGQMRSVSKKSFVVTTVQLTVLDLFNERSFVTVQDLLALDFTSKSLQRAVLPMVKLHLLIRQGDTSPNFAPESNDVYYVNDNFHSRKPIVNLRKNIL